MPDDQNDKNMAELKAELKAEKKKTKFHMFKDEFSFFLWENSVMGLAIGVIIGGAVNAFVQSLVAGILTPLVQLVIPMNTLKGLTYTYQGVNFAFGPLITAFLNLILIAMIVFFTVKYLIFKGGKIERSKLTRD